MSTLYAFGKLGNSPFTAAVTIAYSIGKLRAVANWRWGSVVVPLPPRAKNVRPDIDADTLSRVDWFRIGLFSRIHAATLGLARPFSLAQCGEIRSTNFSFSPGFACLVFM